MRRGRFWLAAIVIAVVVAAVAVVAVGREDPVAEGGPAVQSEGLTDAGPAAFTAARARDLEAAVNERSAAGIKDAVALDETHNAAEIARAALPDGAQLRIDATTFAPTDEPGYGTVQASITGTVDASVTLLLRATDGPWRIVGSTEPEPRT